MEDKIQPRDWVRTCQSPSDVETLRIQYTQSYSGKYLNLVFRFYLIINKNLNTGFDKEASAGEMCVLKWKQRYGWQFFVRINA